MHVDWTKTISISCFRPVPDSLAIGRRKRQAFSPRQSHLVTPLEVIPEGLVVDFVVVLDF